MSDDSITDPRKALSQVIVVGNAAQAEALRPHLPTGVEVVMAEIDRVHEHLKPIEPVPPLLSIDSLMALDAASTQVHVERRAEFPDRPIRPRRSLHGNMAVAMLLASLPPDPMAHELTRDPEPMRRHRPEPPRPRYVPPTPEQEKRERERREAVEALRLAGDTTYQAAQAKQRRKGAKLIAERERKALRGKPCTKCEPIHGYKHDPACTWCAGTGMVR